MGELICKHVDSFATVKGWDGDVLSAIASTAARDRDGEVILPKAFARSIETYMKNPVILANHTHRSTDGKPTIIGSAKSIVIQDDAMLFDMVFASTPLAKEWESLYREGHAKAFSVGFIPNAGEIRNTDGKQVYHHTEVELLEISAVGVPSNREALVRGVTQQELTNMMADFQKGYDEIKSLIAEMKDEIADLVCPERQEYAEALLRGSAQKGTEPAISQDNMELLIKEIRRIGNHA